ncbi:T9SS type A sorting domain-containing protein [Winogradskyella sp. UBA3174]|uniref:T9SS type A sorting domain-containing protein n=1 Tax=Winogradskyella sp. UBA3174 TaxID=1947785 RepID=UPI0025D6C5C1|nr:T9SS type A sorting domain-containing protein [Winogradskyella sp. UBA3174]|tara:strand:- start:48053 stop:51046 length:2994 start_codon:yes stop_codon:yes gene_type:complete
MKKKYSISLLILLASFYFGYCQLLTFEFNGNNGVADAVVSNFNNFALTSSTISRGAGLNALENNNSFASTNWTTTTISDAVTNNDYLEFTITPNAGFQFDVTTMLFKTRRNNNGFTSVALRSSLDGYATNIDEIIPITANSQTVTFNVGQTNNAFAVTYRLYGTANTNGGNGRLGASGANNDIIVNGSISAIATITCSISDNFSATTIDAQWNSVGGDVSIVANELSISTGGVAGYDYVYQDVSAFYNTTLSSLANPITWEFNMRSSVGNPNGFNGNANGIAFVLGNTESDMLEGNGYAVVLGTPGNNTVPDFVRLVRFTNGIDGNASHTNIVADITEYDNDYLSMRVVFDPVTDNWELYVRDDGAFFSNPISLNAGNLIGNAIDNTYTNSSLDFISALWKHNANAGPTATFDNICISSSTSCTATTTWDGLVWDNGVPNINTTVIIDGNFDTSVGSLQTSFSACSLTVNAGNFINIQNGTFIEVQNDIIANGDITVFPGGSVVQVSNFASTVADGTITVQKETSLLNSYFEYTYWSSPVNGETIENTFANVPVSRRFVFNAANFVDLFAEVNNTNTFAPGQDDIDDDGNAWQAASGVMTEGVGYATTAVPAGMLPAPQQFTFEGPFNNGVITPAISNASGGTYSDWNFIGNPYPSAIDAAIFFTTNAGIVDHLFLWSQATPLNANASGNGEENFSVADYAIISASGVSTAGASGITPNGFVPSGQGFFVEALSGTNVTFNNAMRVTGDNNQFFRNSNVTTTNREVLWLNLTSDNGVFSQIAVAHIDGATDNNDGSFYDVKRNVSSENFAKLYSIIDNSTDEFVIQGKAISGLNINEVIELGFNAVIEVPTIYNVSIAQFEGAFYNANTIYLKDNLLGSIHNLKDSNYNFTSEVGEFNNRFEIVFNNNILSIDDNQVDSNDLTLVELANGDVEVKITNSLTITNVKILDMLGRRVYNLSGSNSTEVYNLSKLSKAAYIARVTLSNGQVISKKAVKQK